MPLLEEIQFLLQKWLEGRGVSNPSAKALVDRLHAMAVELSKKGDDIPAAANGRRRKAARRRGVPGQERRNCHDAHGGGLCGWRDADRYS